MRLKRPCNKCEKYFEPATKYTWVCDECMKNIWKIIKAKKLKTKKEKTKKEKTKKNKEK